MPAELPVDQIGECKTNQRFEEDRPEHEGRGGLHRDPHLGVAEDALVVRQADVLDDLVGPVGPVVGKAQPDRPDQRKDVDGEQQQHRRCNEQPGDRAVRQALDPCHHRQRRGLGESTRGAIDHRCSGVGHVALPFAARRARPVREDCTGRASRGVTSELTVVLEHLRPVLDQEIEGFLGRALAGDHIVVEPLLRGLQQ